MKLIHVTLVGLLAGAGTLVSCNSQDKNTAASKPAAQPPAAQASAPAAAAAPASAAPLTVERSVEVSVTAKVKAINQATREVTLQDASGQAVSFVAGPEVRRLNEVSVGDTVTAHYVASLTAELRPPTDEEKATPIAAVAVGARAPKGTEPAAVAAKGVRVLTTVQTIDLAKMLVTLRGPMGDTVTVKARNPENVKKLHAGDSVVVTFAEAMGVALDKAKP